MDGIFVKRKSTFIFNVLGLVSGIILVMMFGFFLVIGEFSSLDEQIASWFFAGFGIFAIVICAVSLYVNKKAFIHADTQGISAFCHFGLSLECRYSDIRHISYNDLGLNLQLTNGKRYSLMNLENVYRIGKYIEKQMPEKPLVFADKDSLLASIRLLNTSRMKKGIASIICVLLPFPEIILTAALTGWKELTEFNSRDWTIFAGMSCVVIITFIAFAVFLRKWVLHTEDYQKNRQLLHKILLLTSPVLPGNALKMFVDDDLHASFRLTVYGYPNSDDVYFTVEQVSHDYELICVHQSRIYAHFYELEPEIQGLIETLPPS